MDSRLNDDKVGSPVMKSRVKAAGSKVTGFSVTFEDVDAAAASTF